MLWDVPERTFGFSDFTRAYATGLAVACCRNTDDTRRDSDSAAADAAFTRGRRPSGLPPKGGRMDGRTDVRRRVWGSLRPVGGVGLTAAAAAAEGVAERIITSHSVFNNATCVCVCVWTTLHKGVRA